MVTARGSLDLDLDLVTTVSPSAKACSHIARS